MPAAEVAQGMCSKTARTVEVDAAAIHEMY